MRRGDREERERGETEGLTVCTCRKDQPPPHVLLDPNYFCS